MRCKLPSFLWPYIEGVSHNPYEHFDSEENLERYETEQKQREWERKIRKQKRVVEAFKRTVENSDPSVVEESKVKLQRERKKLAQMRKDYKAFSEANGLKEQTHRLEITPSESIPDVIEASSAKANASVGEYEINLTDYTKPFKEGLDEIADPDVKRAFKEFERATISADWKIKTGYITRRMSSTLIQEILL